jgi:hypothetical protein
MGLSCHSYKPGETAAASQQNKNSSASVQGEGLGVPKPPECEDNKAFQEARLAAWEVPSSTAS